MPTTSFISHAPPLFGKGPEDDVVFASRVRLARNLAAYPFPGKTGSGELQMVWNEVQATCVTDSPAGPLRCVNVWELEPVDRRWLVEQHVISPALVAHPVHRGVAYRQDGLVSVMVNEEDHLRIQAMRPGFDLAEAFALADAVDDWLGERLDYAFHPDFGFLTTHVSNLGTGMRASVMCHLPALTHLERREGVFDAAGQMGVTIRGQHGEGSKGLGDLFQVSNQFGLGWREEEIVRNVSATARRLVEAEREARELLVKERRGELEDEAWRAYGTLKYARLLDEEEALRLLSRVRLGQLLGLMTPVDKTTIKALMAIVQPAVLETLVGAARGVKGQSHRRAEFIRNVLPG